MNALIRLCVLYHENKPIPRHCKSVNVDAYIEAVLLQFSAPTHYPLSTL